MTEFLRPLADRLADVPGVAAVALGGSRARGTHRPDSDYDLGLYYRGELDLGALRALAAELADEPAEVTAPGGWGPWVDGGAWLTVGGRRVDWIYRDLDRVERVWAECRAGRYEIGFQPGHPLGFYSHAYAGEVALGRVLADPAGGLTRLHEETRDYPAALGAALVAGLWEAGFAVRIARYGAAGDDPVYAAGCLFRAAGVLCQALHGHAGRWLVNEKAMVAAAGRLPGAPPHFAERLGAVLGAVGTGRASITAAIDALVPLVAEVGSVVSSGGGPG
ncbi:nucleotidyltransferase domain-containing protein [Dactylosporangium sp. McL0621]|uniref:nucleotidyltransferase domain-containing protein n=1 Tax=Dactylosporangium sp. McL0621 TaxID=3415678 RepID=UPI003CF3B202